MEEKIDNHQIAKDIPEDIHELLNKVYEIADSCITASDGIDRESFIRIVNKRFIIKERQIV